MTDKPQTPDLTITPWLGINEAPNWRIGRTFGPLLTVAIALLFILALVAAFGVLVRMVFAGAEATLGAGALVAALLGAPFVVWSTILKHQTVMFQKEGHMTDRINKAVEQLGAEKTVERIGRPVTVWTGKRESVSYPVNSLPKEVPSRTKVGEKIYTETWLEESNDVVEEYHRSVTTWAEERTMPIRLTPTPTRSSIEHGCFSP